MKSIAVADLSDNHSGDSDAATARRLNGVAGFLEQSFEFNFKLGDFFVKVEQSADFALHRSDEKQIGRLWRSAFPIPQGFQGKRVFEFSSVLGIPKAMEYGVELILEPCPFGDEKLTVNRYLLDLLGFQGFWS